MIINIGGHCQDRFTASNSEGTFEYGPDYVPSIVGIGGGDDIDIDVETGKIVNWNPERIKQWINDYTNI